MSICTVLGCDNIFLRIGLEILNFRIENGKLVLL